MMKILTYSDPRNIDNMDYWDEIRQYPHLCISQTLVQGLSQKYGRTEFNLICTVDRFLNQFYMEWKNDTQNDIDQFIEMRKIIREIDDIKIRNAFDFNRKDVYAALKFLFETEYEESGIKFENLSVEQKKLLEIYKKLKTSNRWNKLKMLENKDEEDIKLALYEILIEDIKNEIDERDIEREDNSEEKIICDLNNKIRELSEKVESNNKWKGRDNDKIILERLKHYNNLINDKSFTKLKLNKIVIHGVHQFTPMIYKFVRDLEKINIEVIFLFNYIKEYKEIYETWDRVYKWTGITDYLNVNDNVLNKTKLGKNIGQIFNGSIRNLEEDPIEILVFDNMTSFTNYVAEKYENAKKKSESSKSDNVIANMSEQFYSVSGKKANTLLRVYFPEQFGSKHFLSYPIGQFILNLYNMWDSKEKSVFVDLKSIKECLGVNLWSKGEEISVIEIYEKIELFIDDYEIKTFEELIDRIDKQIKNIEKFKSNSKKFKCFEKCSFYGVELDELKYIKNIMIEIKEITEILFKDDETNINEHYKSLMDLLQNKTEESKEISEKEITLVKNIREKLENFEGNITAIEDIKETLGFYLAAKEEDDSANWIVRDFEQIDGGVLLSDNNGKECWKTGAAYYHYAELSDENFAKDIHEILPWPIKINMFNESNKAADIILCSKNEYSNFLKYTLLYGTLFLKKRLKLSYIEEVEEKRNEKYFIFDLLSAKEVKYKDVKRSSEKIENKTNTKKKLLDTKMIDGEGLNTFLFCPHRYLYEYILDEKSLFTSKFHIMYYIKLMIAFKIRNNCKSQNKVDEALRIFDEKLKNYFPFFKDSELEDLRNGIRKILDNWKKNIGQEDSTYQMIREKFFIAKYGDEQAWFKRYDGKNKKDFGEDQYDLIQFIKSEKDVDYGVDKEKCGFCSYRDMCAKAFLEE